MLLLMSGKALIVIFASAGLLAGCSTLPHTPAANPHVSSPSAVVAEPKPLPIAPAKKPAPRTSTRPAPRPPAPNTSLAEMINGTVSQNGRQLTVTRGAPTAAVPLFRQAIVLAAVRALLNNSRPAPQASFQRGQLHLDFASGSEAEIATVINRTLDLPEVTRLLATLP
jgi:hypothetical protein